MKRITLLIGALFVLLPVLNLNAQRVLYYDFENTLEEVNGQGPVLTVLGEQGSFVVETLNEVNQNTKMVYRFAENSGLQFNNADADNIIGTSYTIEIYFVFDELSSWKRVVDWKNRKTDWGAYVYYGQLNFYNILYSNEAPVEEGEYTYYVITRTASDDHVLIYTDAEVKISFNDAGGNALVDEDGVLNFFHDDLVVTGEASSGAVAMIKLYDYPLTQDDITRNWENLGSQVFGFGKPEQKVDAAVYPNPASTEVRLDLSNFERNKDVEISMINSDGRMVFRTRSRNGGGSTDIGTSLYPAGLYLLKAVQGNTIAVTRLMIR
jgi:hypothetical protein